MRKPKKPVTELKSYQRRQAGIEKKRKRHERTLRAKEVVHQVKKKAMNDLAEEVFGEGGLTPARLEALSTVVVGPDGGTIGVTTPQHLRVLINKAREKFYKHADRYVDEHLAAVVAARKVGENDVAARHAEWAIEHLGDDEVRIASMPSKQQTPPSQILLGVNLGGLPKR